MIFLLFTFVSDDDIKNGLTHLPYFAQTIILGLSWEVKLRYLITIKQDSYYT